MKKYEITGIQHPDNPKLFSIQALRDIPKFGVKAGDLGGYIEHEGNLSQAGECWISDYAKVLENAHISDDAHVSGGAKVFGNALVFGEAQVYDNAKVYDNAQVFNLAWVRGNALIFGYAQIFGESSIWGDAQVFDHARVYEDASVYGTTLVNKNMKILEGCFVTSSDQIYYSDGVTAYFDKYDQLIVNGNSSDIEHHKTLARLKLA